MITPKIPIVSPALPYCTPLAILKKVVLIMQGDDGTDVYTHL